MFSIPLYCPKLILITIDLTKSFKVKFYTARGRFDQAYKLHFTDLYRPVPWVMEGAEPWIIYESGWCNPRRN